MNAPEILEAIAEEREHQRAEGFTAEHDREHDLTEWLLLIMAYVGKAAMDAIPDGPLPRHRLIQVAALVFAALESLEQQSPRPDAAGGAGEEGAG